MQVPCAHFFLPTLQTHRPDNTAKNLSGVDADTAYPDFRGGLSQPLWWRARHLRALLCHLFARSAWAQPATAFAGSTGEVAALASVRWVGEGTGSHCSGGHDS